MPVGVLSAERAFVCTTGQPSGCQRLLSMLLIPGGRVSLALRGLLLNFTSFFVYALNFIVGLCESF